MGGREIQWADENLPAHITRRLIEESERERYDRFLEEAHLLKSSQIRRSRLDIHALRRTGRTSVFDSCNREIATNWSDPAAHRHRAPQRT